MKSNTQILILVLLLCLSSGVCLASDGFNAQPFVAFALDSKLGNRSLANQSAVTMAESQELQPRKSANEAFLYSLVIPGMGQLYTGAKRGYIYTAAEVGFLTAFFILRNSAASTRDDYRDVVRDHVIFIGPGSFEDWDPIEDFEHASQYETWNHPYDSETTQKRTGKWYWADLNPDLKNENHGDLEERGLGSKYRLEAFDLRQKANDTFERSKFFLGLAILNHVVSAVEARITTKRFNSRSQNPLTQTQTRPFDIDIQTDILTGGFTGAVVLQRTF